MQIVIRVHGAGTSAGGVALEGAAGEVERLLGSDGSAGSNEEVGRAVVSAGVCTEVTRRDLGMTTGIAPDPGSLDCAALPGNDIAVETAACELGRGRCGQGCRTSTQAGAVLLKEA